MPSGRPCPRKHMICCCRELWIVPPKWILASAELLQEVSEQPKLTNANIPKVDRMPSKNHPRRFRKPSPQALYSQHPPLSVAKKLGAGGLRVAN